MKMPKKMMVLGSMALCIALYGCGSGENPAETAGAISEETEQSSEHTQTGTETDDGTEPALSKVSGAYRQIAMYIQEGFRKYHVEGEYEAYFGPIGGRAEGIWVDGCYVGTGDETSDMFFCCDILLEGQGRQWREGMAFTYDAEADWYTFSSQYEPLLSGDTFYAEWDDSYAAEVLEDCVCQLTISRDADIAAPIRYDSEYGPLEKDLYLEHNWNFACRETGLPYQIVSKAYFYWDERLDTDISIRYPYVKLDEGKEEMEKTVNEKLREAFFYGYEWGEENNTLAPGEQMYTDIERYYLITREDERYLSLRIYEYNSFRGANHPNEWETGITFDMRTGDLVRLEDVLGEDGTGEGYTLGRLLDSGAFRCLWVWLPDDEDWIEELKEEQGEELMNTYQNDFYLTDTGLGLITSRYNEYMCMEADFADLGIEGL